MNFSQCCSAICFTLWEHIEQATKVERPHNASSRRDDREIRVGIVEYFA